jgi:hypothetical protein
MYSISGFFDVSEDVMYPFGGFFIRDGESHHHDGNRFNGQLVDEFGVSNIRGWFDSESSFSFTKNYAEGSSFNYSFEYDEGKGLWNGKYVSTNLAGNSGIFLLSLNGCFEDIESELGPFSLNDLVERVFELVNSLDR